MSTSDKTDFDRWLAAIASQGAVTVLVILLDAGTHVVTPLCSIYLHVHGDEADWGEISTILANSGHTWNAVVFFPVTARNGGPLDNPTAHRRLRELEQRVAAEAHALDAGHAFDTLGHRLDLRREL